MVVSAAPWMALRLSPVVAGPVWFLLPSAWLEAAAPASSSLWASPLAEEGSDRTAWFSGPSVWPWPSVNRPVEAELGRMAWFPDLLPSRAAAAVLQTQLVAVCSAVLPVAKRSNLPSLPSS